MLIDRFLPHFDVTQVVETSVNATPARTFAAIRDTDLRDPLVDALFALRELPQRLMRWCRGEKTSPTPRGKVTFRTLTESGPGWTPLAEEPGVEFVVGSVGRYEARTTTTDAVTARTFRRCWRLIHPGVAVIMGRVLRRIKHQAEREAL